MMDLPGCCATKNDEDSREHTYHPKLKSIINYGHNNRDQPTGVFLDINQNFSTRTPQLRVGAGGGAEGRCGAYTGITNRLFGMKWGEGGSITTRSPVSTFLAGLQVGTMLFGVALTHKRRYREPLLLLKNQASRREFRSGSLRH